MKSVVLFSSGLDSTVNLYEAKEATKVVLALTFDYGQRSAKKECAHAKLHCDRLSIPHKVLDLNWFREFTSTSLVSLGSEVPFDVDLKNQSETVASAKAVWVPNRNGIFLNIAAAFAEAFGAAFVVPGFNIEEAETFPDNSEAYLQAATEAFKFSTSNQVKVRCFTTQMSKKEIVRRGRELKVDFSLIWPCYLGEDKPCLKCESCLRFTRAMEP